MIRSLYKEKAHERIRRKERLMTVRPLFIVNLPHVYPASAVAKQLEDVYMNPILDEVHFWRSDCPIDFKGRVSEMLNQWAASVLAEFHLAYFEVILENSSAYISGHLTEAGLAAREAVRRFLVWDVTKKEVCPMHTREYLRRYLNHDYADRMFVNLPDEYSDVVTERIVRKMMAP